MTLPEIIEPMYLRAGEGEQFSVITEAVAMKATAAETGGAFTLLETRTPPSGGTPAHTQRHDDETMYVLEGTYTVLIGDEQIELGPGGYAHLPRGTLHGYVNTGPQPARMLVLITPGGIQEKFLAEVGDRAARAPWESDMARILAVASKYGIEFAQEEEGSSAP